MRICIVVEGCYPYAVGGVSSWVHGLIHSFPEYEFVIQTIIPNRSTRGKFMYQLPDNVTEVYELYLEDVDWTLPTEPCSHYPFLSIVGWTVPKAPC